jgi:hypothetical protein
MLEAILVGIIDAFLLRKTMQFCSGVDTRRVEQPDLRIRSTYGAPSAVSDHARFVLKQFKIIGDLRAIHPISNTTRHRKGARPPSRRGPPIS